MSTLAATVAPETASVTLALDWTGGPATATIYRVDTGASRTPVRGGEPAALSAGQWVGTDYEAPLDEQVTYIAVDGTGTIGASSPAVVLPSGGQSWLRHPGQPTLSRPVDVAVQDAETRGIAQGVFNIHGRTNPVVVSGRRQGVVTTMTINTATEAETQALWDLLDDGSVLLLTAPGGYGWGSRYVAVGEASAARNSRVASTQRRVFTLPITVTDRPVGLASAGVGNSCADVLTTYATCADLLAAKATCRDLLISVA